MKKRKKELPLWFKIETIIFVIFSVAVGFSYFDRIENLNGLDTYYLFVKFSALISFIIIVWLISLVVCSCDKFKK